MVRIWSLNWFLIFMFRLLIRVIEKAVTYILRTFRNVLSDFLFEFVNKNLYLSDQSWNSFYSAHLHLFFLMNYFRYHNFNCRGWIGCQWLTFYVGSFVSWIQKSKASEKKLTYIELWKQWGVFYLFDRSAKVFLSFYHLKITVFRNLLKNVKNIIAIDTRVSKIEDKLNSIIDHDKLL